MSDGNGNPMGENQQFGPWPIADTEIFATSSLSYAFVNLKPIVPGHVLVSPKQVVPRFTDLTPSQVSDLWTLAQRVGRMLEVHYRVSSLTFAIQDGVEAGQSVPHVHLHVLPRVKGDFEPNDKVYDALDAGDAGRAGAGAGVGAEDVVAKKKNDLDEDRVARSAAEMADEAARYRSYFDKQTG